MVLVVLIFLLVVLFFLLKKEGNIEKFKNSLNVSCLILSYNRPHNIKKSIEDILKIQYIKEIVILNGHKDYKVNFNNPKIKSIDDWDDNDKYFLLRRYKNVNYCKYDNILLLDDDLYPTKELMNNFVNNYVLDKDNIYGSYKRLCNSKGYFTKSKKYNYILPGLCLTSKKVINNIWENIKKNKKFMNLVIEQKGNCEDLLFNYEFNKIYKKNPKYIKGEFISLDKGNGFYTGDTKKHLEIRNNFCKQINKS